MLSRPTASNLEQVHNLLCAQANSASYPAGREISSSLPINQSINVQTFNVRSQSGRKPAYFYRTYRTKRDNGKLKENH